MFGRVIADLRQGRHREAYTMSIVGMVLTLLGLLGVASQRLVLAAILASITFLVFNTTLRSTDRAMVLDAVLQNRESLGAFGQLLDRAEELWVYGPTAVNVLVHAADIRRYVLAKGGKSESSSRIPTPQPRTRCALNSTTAWTSTAPWRTRWPP